MPMRRTIGVSFACLVTSACAIAKAPEPNASRPASETAQAASGNSQVPTARPCSLAGPAFWASRPANDSPERAEPRPSYSTSYVCERTAKRCCDPPAVAQSRQFGKAAWYDFIGNKTASGDILDTVTATAAHRSLPLDSFAKVTDLDNGRSVIVRINDRGPYTRGRIIDLSPHAADALDMKSAGVANVVIEPLSKRDRLLTMAD